MPMLMKRKAMSDEEFERRREAWEREAVEAFLAKFERNSEELRDGIEYLIRQRERLRDEAIAELEAASARLMKELAVLNQRKLLEELACFRDVLALQRRLLDEIDKP